MQRLFAADVVGGDEQRAFYDTPRSPQPAFYAFFVMPSSPARLARGVQLISSVLPTSEIEYVHIMERMERCVCFV